MKKNEIENAWLTIIRVLSECDLDCAVRDELEIIYEALKKIMEGNDE